MSVRGPRARPRKPSSSARRAKHEPADDRGAEFWLGHLLNLSGSLLRDRIREALRPFGITPRAFGLLLEIRRGQGHRQIELARQLGFDRTTMSQLVEELRSLGWIERDTLENDRRVNTLCFTPTGEKRLASAIAAARAIEHQFAACLDPGAVEHLRTALQTMLAHARGESAEVPQPARSRAPRAR